MQVFYDIETLTVNRQAKPSDQKPVEYVVAVEYDYRKKHVSVEFPNLYVMLEYLIKLPIKKIKLIAHNGDRYDVHFLRRVLIDFYALEPHNAYSMNAVDHDNEVSAKSFKGNYMLESRVKARTNLALKFRISGTTFATEDSYPKFQASIKIIGQLLYHKGIIGKQDEKLKYNYTKYDRDNDMTFQEQRRYAYEIYNSLTDHDHKYVHNDTHILYLAYLNYDKLFPTFDVRKRTLSQNILKEYRVNTTADMQLLNKLAMSEINYTDYDFDRENLYSYIHNYYKGGLNAYNDCYLGKILKDIVHIDLNSSYPYALHHFKFPTILLEAEVINDKLNIEADVYYMVKMTKVTFNTYINAIKSKMIRKIFVKYFNNATPYVFMSTPHIKLLSLFLPQPIKSLPVISYLKWGTRYFGGREVIEQNYANKVYGKKHEFSMGEVYVYKVILNGIYGLPALRAFFNMFEYDSESKDYINRINGFRNTERNIAFASAVTAYAFYDLLKPLTYNISGIDKGFMYADTDSIFMTEKYFDTIEQKLHFDDYELGAWAIEHRHIDYMYILNHKKYAYYAFNHKKGKKVITPVAGGITADTFKTDMSFDEFISTQFHNGAKLEVKKHSYTKQNLLVIYNAETEIQQGSPYPTEFTNKNTLLYNIMLDEVARREIEDMDADREQGMYYETPFGSISIPEAFPYRFDNETWDASELLPQDYAMMVKEEERIHETN